MAVSENGMIPRKPGTAAIYARIASDEQTTENQIRRPYRSRAIWSLEWRRGGARHCLVQRRSSAASIGSAMK